MDLSRVNIEMFGTRQGRAINRDQTKDLSSEMRPLTAESVLLSKVLRKGAYGEKDTRMISPKVHVSNAIHFNTIDSYCILRHKKTRLLAEAGASIPMGLQKAPPNLSTHLIWETGRLYEKVLRESILETASLSEVFGNLSCKCGQMSYTGPYIPDTCPNCKTLPVIYREVPLEVGALTGSPDMFVKLPNSKGVLQYHVVEIKTMKDDSFASLGKQSISILYRYQVSMYLLMLRRMSTMTRQYPDFYGVPWEEINTDAGVILYSSKGSKMKAKDLFKIYPIMLHDLNKTQLDQLAEIIVRCSYIKDVQDYQGPGVCHDSNGRFSEELYEQFIKQCPFKDECRAGYTGVEASGGLL